MCDIDLNDGSFQKKKNHRYFYTKDNKSDTVSMNDEEREIGKKWSGKTRIAQRFPLMASNNTPVFTYFSLFGET